MGPFLAFTAAYFLSHFFRSANAVISPILQRELAMGPDALGFMTSAYFLAFALVQIPLGLALDAWGSRWVTAVGLALAAAGGFWFSTAGSYEALVAARLLIGAGMGSVLMGGMMSFSRHFEGNAYRTATSALVGVGSLGGVFAASPLALMVEATGWRNAFAFASVAVVGAAVAVLATDRGGTLKHARAQPAGEAAPSGAFAALLKNRRLWLVAALNGFMAGLLFSLQGLWAGPLLFDTRGFAADAVGFYLVVLGLGAALGFGFAGLFANRFGENRSLLVAVIALKASIWGMVFAPPPLLLGFYFIFGVAGAFNLLLLTQARFIVPASHVGRAITLVNVMGIGGGFALQWLIGEALAYLNPILGVSDPRIPYAISFGIPAVGLLVAAVAYFASAWRPAVGEARRS